MSCSARTGITRIEDLKGKSIAASSPGTPPDIVARAALAAAKMPQSDVKFAAVGGDRERYNALLGGVVDAAVVSNEYIPLPSSKNLHVWRRRAQVLPNSIRFCMLMTGKTLADAPRGCDPFHDGARSKRSATRWRIATTRIKLTREAPAPSPTTRGPAFVFDDAIKPGVVQPDFPIPVDKPRLDAESVRRARPDPEGRRHQARRIDTTSAPRRSSAIGN